MGRLLVGQSYASYYRTAQRRQGVMRRRLREIVTPAIQAAYDEARRVYVGTRSVSNATQSAHRAIERRLEGPFFEEIERDLMEQGHRMIDLVERRRRERSYPFRPRAWLKDSRGSLTRRVQDWMRINTARKVTRVLDTTRDDLRRALTQAENDVETVDETAKRLQRISEQVSRRRGFVIARTEALAASQAGELEGLQAAKADALKRWLDAGDDRVRGAPGGQYPEAEYDHSSVDFDNGLIELDTAFSVNGESLMHPGDPSGSAASVINCRCVQGYELPD